jgi:hypothetical protein
MPEPGPFDDIIRQLQALEDTEKTQRLLRGSADLSQGPSLREELERAVEAQEARNRAPVSSSRQLHTDDKAIILTLGGSAFCAGLFGFYESHEVLGSIFIAGSLIVMAPISPFVRSRVNWVAGRPALWALGLATWLFLAINIALKVWPVSAGNDPRADYWTALTITQQDALTAKLRSVPRRTLEIQCGYRSCNDFADSLVAAFRAVGGWQVTRSKTVGMSSSGTGIFIAPGDETAKLIKAALEDVAKIPGIEVSFAPDPAINGLQQGGMYIGIGGKPLD